MFAVDNVLVSDDLLDAPFSCNLGACHGACCVQGESGAPLEAGETETLDRLLPEVISDLREEAREVITARGGWEEIAPGEFATSCVGGAECVFVTYEGPVAKCALQKAHLEGRTDFPKPISCHLFPIRVENLGDLDALNYEQVGLCNSAVRKGRRDGTQLHDFGREPLIRKYGETWYRKFQEACEERRKLLQPS